MEQLSNLEKRVLGIVQKNKELQDVNNKLTAENKELRAKCEQLESSLMNHSETSKSLEVEKASIKTTIEDLLSSINSLEASK